MEEIWVDINGFEGYYQVSNLGNVKSLKRQSDAKEMGVRNLKERILKFRPEGNGYYRVGLYISGVETIKKVHRLVAESFIENIDNKRCINHKNGIKTDNRVENLEWCTHSENTLHSYKIGLQQPIRLIGKLNPMFGRTGGKNPMFGKSGKRGADHPNSKIVLDQNTGIFYDSAIEAANAKNMKYQTLACQLNGQRPNRTSLIYA